MELNRQNKTMPASMKINSSLLALTFLIFALVAPARAATVCWDGGGDGVFWHDPLNWCNDQVPTAADDVVLDSPVIISGGNITIRSVQSSQAVTISGVSLTVTAGDSQLTGRL